MHRVKVVFGHLSPPNTFKTHSDPIVSGAKCSALSASPDDIVVVHGLRTAIGKAKKGSFKVRRTNVAFKTTGKKLRLGKIYLNGASTPALLDYLL